MLDSAYTFVYNNTMKYTVQQSACGYRWYVVCGRVIALITHDKRIAHNYAAERNNLDK